MKNMKAICLMIGWTNRIQGEQQHASDGSTSWLEPP
jgi:hypothetical protein